MAEDHRDFVRVSSILEIEYRDADAPTPQRARIEDLGEGGAFIDSSLPLPEGTELQFKMHLPGEETPLGGKAVVRWQHPTVGMGIEFQGLSEADRERIKFFVASQFFGRPGPG